MNIDKKIIDLIAILKVKGHIKYDVDFCEAVNILKQNLSKVRRSESSFTVEHIENIVKHYDVNPNWIFGCEDNVFK